MYADAVAAFLRPTVYWWTNFLLCEEMTTGKGPINSRRGRPLENIEHDVVFAFALLAILNTLMFAFDIIFLANNKGYVKQKPFLRLQEDIILLDQTIT